MNSNILSRNFNNLILSRVTSIILLMISFQIPSSYANPIIGVGPFLDDDRYDNCEDSLLLADVNRDGRINQAEYADFINFYSYGNINASFRGLGTYSLAFVNLFYSYSCSTSCNAGIISGNYSLLFGTMQAYFTGRVCCEGTDQPYIPISEASFDTLFYICAYTDEYIREVLIVSDPPSSSPTSKPTQSPTFFPTLTPTQYPTSSPTQTPTRIPSISPTSSPTFFPTSAPTESPTPMPTKAPTNKPTPNPSTIPTFIPTSSSPTFSPTSSPTLSPTQSPTALPTLSPTASPTQIPTETPTAAPTEIPTSSPTNIPTTSPTYFPSSAPSVSPTLSIAPSLTGQLRTEFAYRITVVGYNAEDILSGDNNTIRADLINATTIIVQRLLSTGDPCNPTIVRRSRILKIFTSVVQRYNRKTAEYRDDAPVEILDVIDVECQGVSTTSSSLNQNCILIRSAVTIFCSPDEDCEAVQEEVISGIRDSIENGCFFQALPA